MSWFSCEGAGKSKCIYSFLLKVSSNCSSGAVIEGWRIKATKYTSTNTMGFASCAAPGTPQAGLSSFGHLLCTQSIAENMSYPENWISGHHQGLLCHSMRARTKSGIVQIYCDPRWTSQPFANMHWEMFGDALVLVGRDTVMADFPSCASTQVQVLASPPAAARRQKNKTSFL